MSRTFPTPVDPTLRTPDIIGSHQVYARGTRRIGLIDEVGEHHDDQPWVVVAARSFDEWLAAVTAKRGRPPDAAMLARAQAPGVRFYEISTD